MPSRYNEDRRHHIAKKSMQVTNWSEYNAGLRRRGSLTLWITEEAVVAWRAPTRLTRGGQARNLDTVIETNLLLRSAFRMPRRQAQELMASAFELLNVGLTVTDYTTVFRRLAKGSVHVRIDSTGLKVYGMGQWLLEKHGQRSRCCWRKRPLAANANTKQIVACVLTEQDVDDPSRVGPLLDQIPPELVLDHVTADGAYDGEFSYLTILERQGDIVVVTPPRASAVLRLADGAIWVAVLNRMIAAARPNSVRSGAAAAQTWTSRPKLASLTIHATTSFLD